MFLSTLRDRRLGALTLFLAVGAILSNCGAGGGAGLAAVSKQLHDLDETLNIRIRDATAAGDFYVEKAGRELRLTVKGLLYELDARQGKLLRGLDDLGSQAVQQLQEQMGELDELAGVAVDLEELTYLDAQNLVNRVLPDLQVVTSLRGFSQAASIGGEAHRFEIYGTMFQIGGDARYEVAVGSYSPRDLRVQRAGILEFSVPASVLDPQFRDTEVVRLPFRIRVEHRQPERWYRKTPEWETVYAYEDPEGILLWPRYPVKASIEEVVADPSVNLAVVESLTTTKRVPASGKACKNGDHSCDRSCVVCETVCLDLPAGAQYVSAQAVKTAGRWAEVKNHNIGERRSGTICGKVANWKKSGGASFTYTVRFHPPSEEASVRKISPSLVMNHDAAAAEKAAAGWLRFETDYQVEFDPNRFRSYTLKMRLFTGEPVVVTKGGTNQRVKLAPDFGGPTYKRLVFRVRSEPNRT
jgi:hypothetical protein